MLLLLRGLLLLLRLGRAVVLNFEARLLKIVNLLLGIEMLLCLLRQVLMMLLLIVTVHIPRSAGLRRKSVDASVLQGLRAQAGRMCSIARSLQNLESIASVGVSCGGLLLLLLCLLLFGRLLLGLLVILLAG